MSANLGMSYSVTNVMKEAGIRNITRWLPFKLEEEDLANRMMNKMIRPTTIPQRLEDLIVEHSVAREALRLGLEHHMTIATRLKGIRLQRTISDIFEQKIEETYINMTNINIIVGTGGLLSHVPRRIQGMLILTDAFQPEGVTRMFQDSVFMMPHLGVLSTVYPEASWSIFDKDCLVRLGTVVSPSGSADLGEPVMTVELVMPDGAARREEMRLGEIRRVELAENQEARALITPQKGFDVGKGQGEKVESTVMGGAAGIILDARGRPLRLHEDESARIELLQKWFYALDLYPKDEFRQHQ